MDSPKEKIDIIGTQMSSIYSISYHSSSSQTEMEVDEDFNNKAKKAPKRARRLPIHPKNNKNDEVSSSCVSIDVEENEENPKKITEGSYKTLIKKIQPQYPQRLYAKICNTNDMEKIIFDLLLETETNPQKLVLVLTQLFVDISCYQFVNLETFLKNYDLKDLVPYLEETENSILEKTGKYLLNLTTTPYTTRRDHIEGFFESFVLYCSKHQILYDIVTFKDVFLVLEAMGNSKRISIKHTGVFIALKFNSGLVHVAARYVKKLEEAVTTLKQNPDEEKKKQINEKVQKYKFIHDKVNDMINILRNNVFINNWNSTDPRLHYMRIDYINEILYWLKTFPERYLRNNILDYILSCVTDPHYAVRLKAIQHLQTIVKRYNERILKERMVKIMSLLGLRMRDKNYQVAIAAIDALTIISGYRKIPPHIRLDICRYLYYPYFPLAKACGRFLIQKIMAGNQDTTKPEDYIRSLIYFETNDKNLKNMHPHLIEAIIDDFPYIQDITAFMNLLDIPMTEKEKPVYLKLLTETIRQTFTGKSSLPRTRSRQGHIDKKLNQKMSQEFITGLVQLSTVFPLNDLTEVMVLVYEARKSD